MTTAVLVLVGVVATALFYIVMLVEGVRRPGYDPIYHTGSELELGEHGWIMRATFVVMAAGMFAFAFGLHRALGTMLGAVLLGIFAVGNVLAGVFVPDPVRGFPRGAPIQTPPRTVSWQAKIHDVAGPVMFLALFGACLVVAARLDGPWATYSIVTAITGLGLMIWTAVAYQRDFARTGLIQRGLLGVYYLWIVVVGIHLAS